MSVILVWWFRCWLGFFFERDFSFIFRAIKIHNYVFEKEIVFNQIIAE